MYYLACFSSVLCRLAGGKRTQRTVGANIQTAEYAVQPKDERHWLSTGGTSGQSYIP